MKVFSADPKAKVYVYTKPVSMSYGFPRLSELAGKEAHNGSLFLFTNRKSTYMKVFWYHKDGYCIFAKKLMLGKFDITMEGKIAVSDMQRMVDYIVTDKGKQRRMLKVA